MSEIAQTKPRESPYRPMAFTPYVPPNEGSSLLTVDRDLCWRLNRRGLVTPAVIGAICWARNSFRMTDAQQSAILEGLGLEYYQSAGGGMILRPRDVYRHMPDLQGSEAEGIDITHL